VSDEERIRALIRQSELCAWDAPLKRMLAAECRFHGLHPSEWDDSGILADELRALLQRWSDQAMTGEVHA
jgi:hypothetical protein